MSTKIIPTAEVLAWLRDNQPALQYEVDRNWVWIITDLRKDEKARQAVKEIGFRFKRHGEHTLPSGQTARWAHHCERPIRGKPDPARQKDKGTVQKPARVPPRSANEASGGLSDRSKFISVSVAPTQTDLEEIIRAELGLA